MNGRGERRGGGKQEGGGQGLTVLVRVDGQRLVKPSILFFFRAVESPGGMFLSPAVSGAFASELSRFVRCLERCSSAPPPATVVHPIPASLGDETMKLYR